MNILLIRHGEIPSNVKRIYAGKSHEGLTEKGIFQANDVAEKLIRCEVHSIYTSPILRAVQTAEIIGRRLGRAVETENAFREMELGLWEGMSEDDIALQYPEEWAIWNQKPAELVLPERERLHELQERVLRGVQKIFIKKTNTNIVVITHVAIIRVLMLWKARESLNSYKKIHVPNAEIFKFKINICP